MTADPCQRPNHTGPVGIIPPPCASISSAWVCYYTKPQKERAADVALRESGLETYFPLECYTRADRSKVIRPLFPRYTFARIPGGFPWRQTVRDHARQEVAQMMRSPSGLPLTVPDAVIGALLAQCMPNRVMYPPDPREMRRGDVGMVLQGPLAQFHGLCSRTTRDRVWLLLDILGRKSEVSFTRPQVEIAV